LKTVRTEINMLAVLLSAILLIGSESTLEAQTPATALTSLPKVSTVADLSLPQRSKVPGADLKAERYSLAVVADLPDRVVLIITSNGGKVESEFLAVPSERQSKTAAPAGPTFMKKPVNGLPAVQGFTFADGTSVDFVYPKDEAVQLATANASSVLAIDPTSEGKPAVPQMSPEARQLVALWRLSPTRVGPENTAGIDAKKYEPSATTPALATSSGAPATAVSSPSSSNVETASNVPPSHPAAPRVRAWKELPHTASQQPLLVAAALLCIGFAAVMCFRRLTA
jgi:hypothetical protein